jgi:hypothetical protein
LRYPQRLAAAKKYAVRFKRADTREKAEITSSRDFVPDSWRKMREFLFHFAMSGVAAVIRHHECLRAPRLSKVEDAQRCGNAHGIATQPE